MNILTFSNTLINVNYKRKPNMGDHVAVLESHLGRLASMNTEFDGSTTLFIMISTLKECNEFERLITSVEIMKGDNLS